jgi:hypothetical protein
VVQARINCSLRRKHLSNRDIEHGTDDMDAVTKAKLC